MHSEICLSCYSGNEKQNTKKLLHSTEMLFIRTIILRNVIQHKIIRVTILLQFLHCKMVPQMSFICSFYHQLSMFDNKYSSCSLKML